MPRLPKGVDHGKVEWVGQEYYVPFSLSDGGYGTFSVYTKQRFELALKSRYDIFEEGEHVKQSETALTDRNATEIVYQDGAAKVIRYTLTVDGVEMLVDESYVMRESETVPQAVTMYGVKESRYFSYSFNDLTERPSVEFLSSFGIQDVPDVSAAQ